jgi:hypothetical protein
MPRLASILVSNFGPRKKKFSTVFARLWKSRSDPQVNRFTSQNFSLDSRARVRYDRIGAQNFLRREGGSINAQTLAFLGIRSQNVNTAQILNLIQEALGGGDHFSFHSE